MFFEGGGVTQHSTRVAAGPVLGAGFRVYGSGFRVQSLGVSDVGFRVHGIRFWV